MSDHSELPWALFFDHPDESIRAEIAEIAPANRQGRKAGLDIANVFCCATDPRQLANARLIVCAVNAHHDLVSALEECRKMLRCLGFSYDERMATIAKAETALALAAKEPSC